MSEDTMSGDLILREEPEPGIVRLTFSRPEKLNALSTPMIRAFERELDAIAADRAVRIVILAGGGDPALGAGAHLEGYPGHPPPALLAQPLQHRRGLHHPGGPPQPPPPAHPPPAPP